MFSASTLAAPELIARSSLDYGSFEEVQQLQVTGHIQEDVLLLAEKSTEHLDADYFVIDDVSEDTDSDELVISLTLYRDSAEKLPFQQHNASPIYS